jgi:hypothetical protein
MMRRTKESMTGLARLALLGALLATMISCTATESAPAADKYLGTFAHGGYLFLRWQEGLEVMIWFDLGRDVEHSAQSAGSTDGPVYTERGSVQSADGQILAWDLQTSDGKTGKIQMGDSRYDLSAGNLFVVTSQAGGLEVEQLSRDLSAVPLDHDGILAWAEKNLELVPPVVTTDSQLVATLAAPASLRRGDPVRVEFTLTNASDLDLYVLQWYTPLEGIWGEIFRVTRDGRAIPYEGPLVSRGAPLPEEYVFLEPGASVSATVDLSPVYDFSEPGTYTIAFQSPRISHVAQNEAEMATSVEELHPVDMPSNRVEIVIEAP